jgi:alkylation response protein AidB-like acyl-CoA dehydrogenase
MDVRLSDEQRALRDSAARLVERVGPGSVADLDDLDRRARLVAAVTESGWRELRDSDGDGRPLASVVEVALVAEELSRGVADVAFLGPILAAELRRLTGVETPDSGQTVVLRADLGALAEGSVLADGVLAIDGEGAVTALTLLPADGGWFPGVVHVGKPAAEPVDLTRSVAGVETTVPTAIASATVLDADGLARFTAFGLAVTCAELVGVMRGAIDLAVRYASDRRQYGAPIGSFQAVAHLLADAHVAMEGSRTVALNAAWAVDAVSPAEALAAAAVAKAYCSRAARGVCETVIQVHGGIGNTWECLAHVFLRRALLSIDVLGGIGPNLERVLQVHEIGVDRGLR